MLLEKNTVEQGATLAIWKITETVDELLEMLDLDPFVIAEIAQFTSEKRKLEYLAVRVMLNEVLGTKKSIVYEPNGKPCIADGSYQISITHTGQYAAIILHPTLRLGIDIERIAERVVRVQGKFLSARELAFVDAATAKTHLALMWSAKEALYKIVQQTEIDFTQHFSIAPFTPYLSGTMSAQETKTAAAERFELSYRVFPEFVLVWTVK